MMTRGEKFNFSKQCHLQIQYCVPNTFQNRYLSFHTGFGSRLASGDATLEDCEEQARLLYQQHQLQPPSAGGGADWGAPGPSRSDHWELVCGRYIEQERGARL